MMPSDKPNDTRFAQNRSRRACEQDALRYIECLEAAPNGWGQHIIDGVQSHEFLRRIYQKHGQENVEAAFYKLRGWAPIK